MKPIKLKGWDMTFRIYANRIFTEDHTPFFTVIGTFERGSQKESIEFYFCLEPDGTWDLKSYGMWKTESDTYDVFDDDELIELSKQTILTHPDTIKKFKSIRLNVLIEHNIGLAF